jgi:dimethylargininase
MLAAITRDVSAGLASCELTHLPRTPIDVTLARRQHRQYEAALARLGCEVVRLAALPDLPDSVFVEDVAVVVDEVAVVTRPGAQSRRAEIEHIREPLSRFRRVAAVESPGTLDGGDVLRIGRRIYVGMSGRSNPEGIDQLRTLLAVHGYSVTGVPVTGCLHLKSAVTEVWPGVLLVNRDWVVPDAFGDVEVVEVDPAEPYAANGLLLSWRATSAGRDAGPTDASRPRNVTIYPAAFPRTRAILESHGIRLEVVDVSELQKAEGAVTCCSIVFEACNWSQAPRP